MGNPCMHINETLTETRISGSRVRRTRKSSSAALVGSTPVYVLFTTALESLQNAFGFELSGWEIVADHDARRWTASAWVKSADHTGRIVIRAGHDRDLNSIDMAMRALLAELLIVEGEVVR